MMTAWIFIIIGIGLIVTGLHRILLQFRPEFDQRKYEISKEFELAYRQDAVSEVVFREQQERLEKVEEEMDRLVKEIDWKAKVIKRKMENIFLEVEKSDNPQFNQILNSALEEKGTEVLPERYGEIFTLYREGFKLEDIAEKLGLGVRETELILKMYKKEADTIAK